MKAKNLSFKKFPGSFTQSAVLGSHCQVRLFFALESYCSGQFDFCWAQKRRPDRLFPFKFQNKVFCNPWHGRSQRNENTEASVRLGQTGSLSLHTHDHHKPHFWRGRKREDLLIKRRANTCHPPDILLKNCFRLGQGRWQLAWARSHPESQQAHGLASGWTP